MSGLGPLANPLTGLPGRNLALSYEIAWQSGGPLGIGFLHRRLRALPAGDRDFAKQLAHRFPDDFSTVYPTNLISKRNAQVRQTFFIVSYAVGRRKLSLQPRLMLGATRFGPQGAEVALKRRDSNQLSILRLKSKIISGVLSKSTFGAGFLAEWSFWRRWSLFGMADVTRFKYNLTYTYYLENQIDKAVTVEELAGDKFVYPLQAGAGISFRLSKK